MKEQDSNTIAKRVADKATGQSPPFKVTLKQGILDDPRMVEVVFQNGVEEDTYAIALTVNSLKKALQEYFSQGETIASVKL